MPPKKKGPGVKAASSSSVADDPATQAKELQQELRLWQTYPDACKLIRTQSEVYHAALEGAEKGKVFIYPIIAAFGQEIGAADPSEEEMDKRMRLVELLAVVDKAPEPKKKQIFLCVSESFGLCPQLEDDCTEEEEEDVAALLEKMHDIGEYLQLDKRLCARIKQLMAAQAIDMEEANVDQIMEDKVIGPLVKATLDKLAATEVPQVLATVAPADVLFRLPLDLPGLLASTKTKEGALGFDSGNHNLSWNVDDSPIDIVEGQLHLLFGLAVAERYLWVSLLEAVRASMEFRYPPIEQLAKRILEALVVLGRGKAALEILEECDVEMPKYLKKHGDTLKVKGSA